MNTKTKTDERILNASAKAIGPCHLPSKREMSAADKSAHTPGPWKVVEAAGEVTVFDNGAPRLIARCGKWFRSDDQANARLIAAAPDLLAALREARAILAPLVHKMNVREHFSEKNILANVIDKAIQKAEGSAQ